MRVNRRSHWWFSWSWVIGAVLVAAFGLEPGVSRARALRSSPTRTWLTDGAIESVLATGSRVYIGGSFNYVGPRTGRSAVLRRSNGSVLPNFPAVNRDV